MDDTKGETSANRGESESEMSEVKLFMTTLLALLRNNKTSSAQSYESLRLLSCGRSCKNPDCSGQVEPPWWSGQVYCKECRTAHRQSLGDGPNESNKSESVGGRKFPRDEARRSAGTGRARPPRTAAHAPGAPGATAAPAAAKAESSGASGAACHAEDECAADATGEPAAGAAPATVALVSALTLKRKAAAAAAHAPPGTRGSRSSRRRAATHRREAQSARDKAGGLSGRNAAKIAAAEVAAAAAAVKLSKTETHAAHQAEAAAARSTEAEAAPAPRAEDAALEAEAAVVAARKVNFPPAAPSPPGWRRHGRAWGGPRCRGGYRAPQESFAKDTEGAPAAKAGGQARADPRLRAPPPFAGSSVESSIAGRCAARCARGEDGIV